MLETGTANGGNGSTGIIHGDTYRREETAANIVDSTSPEGERVRQLYGVKYWQPGEVDVYESPRTHLYHFKTFIGDHEVEVERGDSLWFIDENNETARVVSGPVKVRSKFFGNLMRGYTPATRSIELEGCTTLPYVNGCSTKQLIPPPRAGDPTLQYLNIPAYSAEQAHHIHSTVRTVYVWKGRGISIVGMEGAEVHEELKPGMVCVLEPMCPHHFETPWDTSITVIPFHVFSSSGSAEFNHPMFNGTHLMNQGG